MTKRIIPAALCLLMFIALVGCANHNAVKLTYALGKSTAPCSGDVTVFKFEDKRLQSKLGTASNGQAINTLSNAADWVGWALFDELKAAGCNPKYRTSTVTPGTEPLITGEVLDLSLNQTGTTTYAGKLTVKFMIEKDGKVVLAEKYTSEVENIVVPGYGTQSDILAETLRTLIGEAMPAICAKI